MSNTETDIQVSDPSAPVRNDYDFNLTDPNKMSVGNILALAKLAARGGMSDPKGAEGLAIRAVFAIQMGFSPVEGMQGLYLIEGKPVVGAQLLGAGIRRSGRYDYKVIEHDATKCVLEGFRIENGQKESLGMASFTMAEAVAAGLANKAIWQKYPQNMLYARAMANLYRWHMPDLIGMPFYTEGEDPEPSNPEPTVAEKAATAAMERAAKGRKKSEPEPPKEEVIEAEFTVETGGAATADQEPEAQTQEAPEVIIIEPDKEPDQSAPTGPTHIVMAEPEAEAPAAQMSENPISAGQFDPLDDTAPQNRFAVIEGWGDPEPVDGLTPDLGVVGYHHILKKREDGKFWAVFDRESGTQLEKIQVSAGSDDNFNHLIGAMTSADQAFRYTDPVLAKACDEKNAHSNPTNKAVVCLAVRAIRTAKKSPAKAEAPAPETPAIGTDMSASEAILADVVGQTAVTRYKDSATKKGKDVALFFALAIDYASDPANAEKSAADIEKQLNLRFMTWSNEK